MVVLADAAPWRSRSRPDMQAAVDRSASGCPAGCCRSVRVPLPQSRVSTVPAACGLPVSAGRVRCPTFGPPMSAGCADLARNPGASANRTPRQCPLDVRECGSCWPDGRSPPRTQPQPPEQGRGMDGRRQPTRPCRLTSYGSGGQLPHTASTAAAAPRRGRLSRPGCPPHGGLPQPAGHCGQCPRCVRNRGRPAMPSGRLVSTADTAAACEVAAATGSGRRTGGC
jgi:hypothetical protein